MPWKKVIVIVTALVTERVARDFGEVGTLVCIQVVKFILSQLPAEKYA